MGRFAAHIAFPGRVDRPEASVRQFRSSRELGGLFVVYWRYGLENSPKSENHGPISIGSVQDPGWLFAATGWPLYRTPGRRREYDGGHGARNASRHVYANRGPNRYWYILTSGRPSFRRHMRLICKSGGKLWLQPAILGHSRKQEGDNFCQNCRNFRFVGENADPVDIAIGIF